MSEAFTWSCDASLTSSPPIPRSPHTFALFLPLPPRQCLRPAFPSTVPVSPFRNTERERQRERTVKGGARDTHHPRRIAVLFTAIIIQSDVMWRPLFFFLLRHSIIAFNDWAIRHLCVCVRSSYGSRLFPCLFVIFCVECFASNVHVIYTRSRIYRSSFPYRSKYDLRLAARKR